jgi:cysteinyl-tRNA synthetase
VSIDEFASSARLIGLLEDNAVMGAWVFGGAVDRIAMSLRLEELANKLSCARSVAMESKDFSEVDRLKAALISAGVEVRMSKDGVELLPDAGFDPAKLEALK